MDIYIDARIENGLGKWYEKHLNDFTGWILFIRQLLSVKARHNSAPSSQVPGGMPWRWQSSARAYWHQPHRRNQRSPGPTEESWISAHNRWSTSDPTPHAAHPSPCHTQWNDCWAHTLFTSRTTLELMIFNGEISHPFEAQTYIHPKRSLGVLDNMASVVGQASEKRTWSPSHPTAIPQSSCQWFLYSAATKSWADYAASNGLLKRTGSLSSSELKKQSWGHLCWALLCCLKKGNKKKAFRTSSRWGVQKTLQNGNGCHWDWCLNDNYTFTHGFVGSTPF